MSYIASAGRLHLGICVPALRFVWVTLLFSLFATHQASAESDEFWQYPIKRGDTLIGIAKRYLIEQERWLELKNSNGVKNARALKPGLPLRIPINKTKIAPVFATASLISGKVERQVGAKGEKKILRTGDQLSEGDRIISGPDANAKLEFLDGSFLQLQRDTIVTLKLLQGQAAARLSSVQILVEQGRVETMVTPLKGNVTRYEILTPTAQIGVRGTNFRVNFDPLNSMSRSEVLQGAVNARNALGSENIAKDFGTVIPPKAAPSPPIALLSGPRAEDIAAFVDRLPVRIPWVAVNGAAQYRVKVASVANPATLVEEKVFERAEAVFGELPDGRYVLRIRAIDENGLEGKETERVVDIKARPVPPFLESPQSKSTVRGDKPELRWTLNDDAAKYHVQIAADAGFKSLLLDAADAGINKIVTSTSIAPGEYFWRVASKRANGDRGPFSDRQPFTLKAIPMLSDKDTQPPAVNDQTMAFTFPQSEPGQKYHFQLARSRQFDPILKDLMLTEPRAELPRASGQELFMRVQIIDSDGYIAPYGPVQRIELPRQEMKPDWSVEDKLIRLVWKQALPGQQYRVQLARDAAFVKLLADVQSSEPSHAVPRPVASRVYLRTQVTDSDGFVAPFSEPIMLDLPLNTPMLTSPVLQGTALRFAWSDVEPGQRVRLQVSRDRRFKFLQWDELVARPYLAKYLPAAGEYYVRIALVDADGFSAEFGNPQRMIMPGLNQVPGWQSLPLLPAD